MSDTAADEPGAAGPSQQVPFFIPQHEWALHYTRMQDTYAMQMEVHEMMRHLQLTQTAHTHMIRDLQSGRLQDRARLDTIAAEQRRQGQRQDEMYDLLQAMRSHQLGGDYSTGPSRGPDDPAH